MYAIKVTKHYNGPRDTVGYYVNDFEFQGERSKAKRLSKQRAEELVYEFENGEYRLSYNENSRPTFQIVRV